MSDENNPIGEPKPFEGDQGLNIWPAMNAIAVVTLGVVAFAVTMRPARVQGASRSARLEWQQRGKELQQANELAGPVEKQAPTSSEKDGKPASSNQ